MLRGQLGRVGVMMRQGKMGRSGMRKRTNTIAMLAVAMPKNFEPDPFNCCAGTALKRSPLAPR
jgi:hypothetical protein